MRIVLLPLISGIAMAGLSACGDTAPQQAIIGAGLGVGGAAIVGGNLAGGAIAGGAANLIYCQSVPGSCR